MSHMPYETGSDPILPDWVRLPSGRCLNLRQVSQIIPVSQTTTKAGGPAETVPGVHVSFGAWTFSIWGHDAIALTNLMQDFAQWQLGEPDEQVKTKS